MVKFRNLSIDSSAPVSKWGAEGILTALERGNIKDWARIYRALLKDKNKVVRKNLTQALDMTAGGYLGEDMVPVFNLILKELS
jgi:hypothetical protein